MPTESGRRVATVCLILLLGAIFVGGEAPGAGSLFAPPWDKLAHLLVFGSIGVFVALSVPTLPTIAILPIVAAIGAMDEIHQLFLSGRQAGFGDWLADLVGGMLALLIATRLRFVYAAIPGRDKVR